MRNVTVAAHTYLDVIHTKNPHNSVDQQLKSKMDFKKIHLNKNGINISK